MEKKKKQRVLPKKELEKKGGKSDEDDEGESQELEKEDAERINLKQFNPVKQVKPDSFILIQGKRRYGKSTWMQWLLYFLRFYFGGVYVFTKTKHNHFWQQHVPKKRIYNGFQDNVALAILREQKEKRELMAMGEYSVQQRGSPYVLIILEDLISEEGINTNPVLNEMAFSGRHSDIMVIATSQDVKGFGPKIRGNADLLAMTYSLNRRVFESIADDFAGLYQDKKVIPALIKRYTVDFGLIVIDQTEARYDAREIFYHSKAKEEMPPYYIGSIAFWNSTKDSWKAQLQEYNNLKKMKDSEYWFKYGKKREHTDKNEEKNTEKFVVNTPGAASPEEQEIVRKAYLREIGADKSNVERASSVFDDLFDYRRT